MLSTPFSFCMHNTFKKTKKHQKKNTLAPLADYSLTRTSRESQDSRGDSKLVCPALETVDPFLQVTMSRCRRVRVAFSLYQCSAVRFPKCIVYSPVLVLETVKRKVKLVAVSLLVDISPAVCIIIASFDWQSYSF